MSYDWPPKTSIVHNRSLFKFQYSRECDVTSVKTIHFYQSIKTPQSRGPDGCDITHCDVCWPFPSPLPPWTQRDTFRKSEVKGHLPSLVFTFNSLWECQKRETFFCLHPWFKQCEKAKACKIRPEVGGGPLQRCAFCSAWPKVQPLSPLTLPPHNNTNEQWWSK